MIRYSFFIFFLFLGFQLSAQQELGLHFLRDNWLARSTNPAFGSDHKLVIGLPGVYNNLLITNLVYNDLVIEEGGQKVLDINRGIDKLEANSNIIRENLRVETVQVGIQLDNWLLSLGHSVRFNAFLDYPKTLPQLIWQGNAQFVGQNVDFSTDTQLFGYNEFNLGLSIPITPKLRLGGSLKYLTGFGDISTETNRLSLYTDDDVYQLRLNSDLTINNTGSIEYNGFRDLQVNYNFGQFEGEDLFTGNNGLAFDLGLQLDLGKLDIAASILDIGQINWESSVKNYTLKGDYEFDGLDIADEILDDATALGSVIDTLIETYEVVETSLSYSTKLGTKTYLSATYQLTEKWRLGALFYNEEYRGKNYPSVAIGGTVALKPWLTAGAHYAIRNETYDNIGLNLQARIGPVNILAATDNLLTALDIKNSNSANIRLGMYLALSQSIKESN